jgi:hypothetical protein
MPFLDDVSTLVGNEISHIGLAVDDSTEVSGGGYAHQEAVYTDGVLQGTPLTFNGTPGVQVTHLLFKRAGSAWTFRPCPPVEFNSEGLIRIPSGVVAAEFPTV